MELVLQRPQRKESVKKYSVLYVDDEPVNLRIFQHAFKRDYNIYTALNGFDALEILNDKKIDLIITDQQMPRMSGVDLLAKIVPKHPNIVRMIMTGFSDIGAIIRAVNEFGLDKYLVKPWDRDQLKVEFDKALENKEKKEKAASSNGVDDSFVKVNDSALPRESDLQQHLNDSFILYDKTATNNGSYWFGEKDGKIVMCYFSTSENSASHIGLKSFLSLCLIEGVYKSAKLDPAMVLDDLLKRLYDRYNDVSDNLGQLDISMMVLDAKAGEVHYSGVNLNAYYFDAQGKMKMLNGYNEPHDIKSDKFPGLKSVKADNVTEAYLISKNILNQIVSTSEKASEGTSFLQFMRELREKPMVDQKSVIEQKLAGEVDKCMIGVRLARD